jgi:hypothetical protein
MAVLPRLTTVVVLMSVLGCSTAFQSSFTGRANSVCRREELTTGFSCPPERSNLIRREAVSMPPFLKKLGLKKPDKPFFGVAEESSTTPANTNAIMSEPEVETTSKMETLAEDDENLSYAEKTLKKVKDSGKAGIISYALWELAFWLISIPVCIFGYYELAGHWPDLTDKEDLEKVGAEAFAFVNFARIAVPLRLGLAFSTIPWIQENIVDKFMDKKDGDDASEE